MQYDNLSSFSGIILLWNHIPRYTVTVLMFLRNVMENILRKCHIKIAGLFAANKLYYWYWAPNDHCNFHFFHIAQPYFTQLFIWLYLAVLIDSSFGFSNMRIGCFSLSYMTINWIIVCFLLLVGQNNEFVDDKLETFIYFLTVCRQSD